MGFLSTYWTDFIGRFDGPLHFRLFVQPPMAILFAVRDGSRDAREGRSAYLWAVLTDPTQRRYLPLQALLTATVLAVIPYALLRGPVNRLVRMSQTRGLHL
jgi:hypothetical protein